MYCATGGEGAGFNISLRVSRNFGCEVGIVWDGEHTFTSNGEREKLRKRSIFSLCGVMSLLILACELSK